MTSSRTNGHSDSDLLVPPVVNGDTGDPDDVSQIRKVCRRKGPRDLDRLRELLRVGASGLVNQADSGGRTPLYHVVRHRYLDTDLPFLTLLLDHGADLAGHETDALKPLFLKACQEGWVETVVEVVARLKQLGDVYMEGDLDVRLATGLGMTLDRKYQAEVELTELAEPLGLERRPRDLLVDGSRLGEVPGSTTWRYTRIAEALIESGAFLHGGKTATLLHEACLHGDVHLTRLLLAAGARVDATDQDGATPLHYACRSADLQCVRLVVDAGADVTRLTRHQRSPLHYTFLPILSAVGENADIVGLLMERGADIRVADYKHKTAVDYAVSMTARPPRLSSLLEALLRLPVLLPSLDEMGSVFPVLQMEMCTWLTIQKMALLLQAGLEDTNRLACFCAGYFVIFPVDDFLSPAEPALAAVEFASWVSPDQNYMLDGPGQSTDRAGRIAHKHLFVFSSLRKWSACAVRRQLFTARGRHSILPSIDRLQGEVPSSLLPLLRISGPTNRILTLNRLHQVTH